MLRSVRSELIRLDQATGERMKATDPDPADVARARDERAALAARKRTESRQWSLALNTETQRARVEATGRLRTYIAAAAGGLPQPDRQGRRRRAQGPAAGRSTRRCTRCRVRLSHDLEFRFRKVGERVLAQVFDADELQYVLRRLNATLRHALASRAAAGRPAPTT